MMEWYYQASEECDKQYVDRQWIYISLIVDLSFIVHCVNSMVSDVTVIN